jgi:hypothetical protein
MHCVMAWQNDLIEGPRDIDSLAFLLVARASGAREAPLAGQTYWCSW